MTVYLPRTFPGSLFDQKRFRRLFLFGYTVTVGRHTIGHKKAPSIKSTATTPCPGCGKLTVVKNPYGLEQKTSTISGLHDFRNGRAFLVEALKSVGNTFIDRTLYRGTYYLFRLAVLHAIRVYNVYVYVYL